MISRLVQHQYVRLPVDQFAQPYLCLFSSAEYTDLTLDMLRRKSAFCQCGTHLILCKVSRFDAAKILALCEKAHFHPQQVLCYCVGVRAEEVAAAILDGADTPEEISSRTGIRTGCTIECIQPILRLLEAAGIQPKPNPDGWQWYGETVTAWTMPEKVKQKYASRGFYFDEDRKLLDQVAATNQEI